MANIQLIVGLLIVFAVAWVFFGGGATVFKAMSLTPKDSDNIEITASKTKEKKHYWKLFKGVIASFIVFFVVIVVLAKTVLR